MSDNVTSNIKFDVHRRIEKEIRDNQNALKAYNSKRLKPLSIAGMLFALVAAFLVLWPNFSSRYLSDAVIFYTPLVILGVFFVFGLILSSQPGRRSKNIYDTKAAIGTIRRVLFDQPLIIQMSDQMLHQILVNKVDYLSSIKSKTFLDSDKFTDYLNLKGIIVDAEVVDLILDAETVYLTEMELQSVGVSNKKE